MYGPPAEKADTAKAARPGSRMARSRQALLPLRTGHFICWVWPGPMRIPRRLPRRRRPWPRRSVRMEGWSQLASMGSDAYATGEALYALNAAGRHAASRSCLCQGSEVSAEHAGSRRLLAREVALHLAAALLRSGFPYGHDQWISAAGTSWAVMALSATVDAPNSATREAEIASGKRRR